MSIFSPRKAAKIIASSTNPMAGRKDCGMSTIRVILEPRGSGRTAVLTVVYGQRDATIRELVIGRSSVVCEAARRLIALGYDPDDRLEAYRGSTLCLSGTLAAFAGLYVHEGALRPVFARFTGRPVHWG